MKDKNREVEKKKVINEIIQRFKCAFFDSHKKPLIKQVKHVATCSVCDRWLFWNGHKWI